MVDLATIQKIMETYDKDDANSYIKAGWTLLAVAPGNFSDSGQSCVLYSLGLDATQIHALDS